MGAILTGEAFRFPFRSVKKSETSSVMLCTGSSSSESSMKIGAERGARMGTRDAAGAYGRLGPDMLMMSSSPSLIKM
jgi:hypothetical protein